MKRDDKVALHGATVFDDIRTADTLVKCLCLKKKKEKRKKGWERVLAGQIRICGAFTRSENARSSNRTESNRVSRVNPSRDSIFSPLHRRMELSRAFPSSNASVTRLDKISR